jgi:hypothetical protein
MPLKKISYLQAKFELSRYAKKIKRYKETKPILARIIKDEEDKINLFKDIPSSPTNINIGDFVVKSKFNNLYFIPERKFIYRYVETDEVKDEFKVYEPQGHCWGYEFDYFDDVSFFDLYGNFYQIEQGDFIVSTDEWDISDLTCIKKAEFNYSYKEKPIKEINCPKCKGKKVLIDSIKQEEVDCSFCEGLGKTTDDRLTWIENGNKIKEKRESKNISIENYASMYKLEPNTLEKMEEGKVEPDRRLY